MDVNKQEQFVDWIGEKALETLSNVTAIMLSDEPEEKKADKLSEQAGRMSMLKDTLKEFTKILKS